MHINTILIYSSKIISCFGALSTVAVCLQTNEPSTCDFTDLWTLEVFGSLQSWNPELSKTWNRLKRWVAIVHWCFRSKAARNPKQIWGRNLCDCRWHPDGQRCGIESRSCTLALICSHQGGWQWNAPKMLPILDLHIWDAQSSDNNEAGWLLCPSGKCVLMCFWISSIEASHVFKNRKRSGGCFIINITRILSHWPRCGTRHSQGLCERVINDHRCDLSSKQHGLGSVVSAVGQWVFCGSAFR